MSPTDLNQTGKSDPSHKADIEFINNGKALVVQLNILVKMATLHHPTNASFDAPIETLLKTLELLLAMDEPVTLIREGDSLFLNEEKLRMDSETFSSFANFIEYMAKRGIGKIICSRGIRSGDIRQFIFCMGKIDFKDGEDPFSLAQVALEKEPVQFIELTEYVEKKAVDSFNINKGSKEFAKKTYANTVSAVSQVMDSAKLNQAVSLKKTKRLVQSMVDLILQEESVLMGLTNLRSYDEYTYNHSVNVCVLSLGIGQRLGYDKIELSNLGMASLFHDIGKSDVPVEVLNKPTEFNEEEWAIIRRHPVMGVRNIMKIKGFNELSIKVMYGSFEHHMNYDNSGYPKLVRKRNLSIFGRIISTADCYDAMTSARVYTRSPLPSDKALQLMLKKSGAAFDPLIMKVFVNCIGVFPIGTLVLLDTNEIGVVYKTHPEVEKGNRPMVKVIVNQAGQEVDGDVVDLSEKVDVATEYKRNILKTIDPHKYKIDVSKYFM
ncbi:MAG TPA: HD-GYP domain-containing protein [Nitrospiria bacterium]|nr:HD-GYP domain-containing protein [Nitrospiria bacterium]